MRLQFLSAIVAASAVGAAALPTAEHHSKGIPATSISYGSPMVTASPPSDCAAVSGSASAIKSSRSVLARRFGSSTFNRRLINLKRDDDDDDDDSGNSIVSVSTSSASYGSPMITAAPPSGSVTTTAV